MERTIKVTGKGKISVKPDTIRIVITQTAVEKNYEGAILESANRKKELGDGLKTLGFEKDAIKTLYFNIDAEHESYQDKNHCWKSRLIGYRYTHRMKLEFPADNERLGKVLWVVAHLPGRPEFSIEHTVANPEAAKNELLSKAVEDSMAKAAVLSKAAGVELAEILAIDYSWGEIDFVTNPMSDMMLGKCYEMEQEATRCIDIDIEADDIDVTDTVTVVWKIV